MDIKEKENILAASCKKLLAKDMEQLNQTINTDIEGQMNQELQEYERKEEFAYQKKVEKLEKDYNKQIYSIEINAKKELLNQKKLIQKDLKKHVTRNVKGFYQ